MELQERQLDRSYFSKSKQQMKIMSELEESHDQVKSENERVRKEIQTIKDYIREK